MKGNKVNEQTKNVRRGIKKRKASAPKGSQKPKSDYEFKYGKVKGPTGDFKGSM